MREDWHQEDPQLIAEVLFAVTSMLSFTRLAYILPAHESLGTLQISIGKMIDDMMRYKHFSFYLFLYKSLHTCILSFPLGEFSAYGITNECFIFLC